MTYDVRFPTSRTRRRLGRHEPGSRLLGGLRRARDRRAGGLDRPRPDVHDRPRHRGLRRRDRGARAAPRRRDRRGARRRPRRTLAAARHRHPAALARPREGRHPPGDRGARQRRLGPVRASSRRSRSGSSSPTCRRSRSSPASTSATSTTRSRRTRRSRSSARNEPTKARARGSCCSREGFPAYTTSAGWLGYAGRDAPERAREALAAGFTHLKLKVGGDLESDLRRARLVREAIGPDIGCRSTRTRRGASSRRSTRSGGLSEVDPWWIEEPTSPDDILGHQRIREAVAPVRVATGEHVQNRVVFKQLLQLGRDRRLPARLLPARRRQRGARGAAPGGEVRRPGLPARRRRRAVRVRPARLDVRLRRRRGSLDDRVCEFVDHLHEHFVDPVRVDGGRYLARRRRATASRSGRSRWPSSRFPDGPGWWRGAEVPRDQRQEAIDRGRRRR